MIDVILPPLPPPPLTRSKRTLGISLPSRLNRVRQNQKDRESDSAIAIHVETDIEVERVADRFAKVGGEQEEVAEIRNVIAIEIEDRSA